MKKIMVLSALILGIHFSFAVTKQNTASVSQANMSPDLKKNPKTCDKGGNVKTNSNSTKKACCKK